MTFTTPNSEHDVYIWWNEERFTRVSPYMAIHHVVGISTDTVDRMLLLTTSDGRTYAFNLDAVNYYEIYKEET